MTAHEHPDEQDPRDFIFICPSYLDCVLAAGDAGDIEVLRDWCAALPRKSYGKVFIEIDSPMQIQLLETPPGVGVTWIERNSTASPTGETPKHGEALMRAVEGWLDEWVRGDPLSGRNVRLWSGARGSSEVSEHWDRIEEELAEIWAVAAEYRDQLA
ncbi:MAG: SIP domain-containing protein [Leucobacter sp.]